jgi:hypothetical protein
MSTEIVWANRNLAVLARLYRLRNIQPAWKPQGDGQYRVTLRSGDRVVSVVLNRDELIAAWKGSEVDQSAIIRNLTQFLRALTDDAIRSPSAG